MGKMCWICVSWNGTVVIWKVTNKGMNAHLQQDCLVGFFNVISLIG